MSKTRGVFISFESIDGLGKTTQLRLLGETLTQAGFDVVLRREPGSSNVGLGARYLLFGEGELRTREGDRIPPPTTKGMAPGVADCLFLADHIQNAADIAEYIADGKVVLCDRYADSQFAYASSPTKACPRWALDAYTRNFGLVPDITVLLVARGPETGAYDGNTGTTDGLEPAKLTMHEDIGWALTRAQKRRGIEAGKQDGKAWNDVNEQRKIQNGYLEQLQGHERTLIVDVREQDDIETVRAHILRGILDRGLVQKIHPSIHEAIKEVHDRIVVAYVNPKAIAA